ncbi:uncharacterized protein [Clytia hemisphaerica]|uniref:uncharacterized protein isoform X2 n=1 Tax=Clytia hemisphaerica TaxID=252671 RepID=UPI0034D3C47B
MCLIKDDHVYHILAIFFLWTSTIYIILGCLTFFTQPEYFIKKESHDSHLLPFILGITGVVVSQELLYFIGAFSDGGNIRKRTYFASSACQKFFQIIVYYFILTDSVPDKKSFRGASWYYKAIALINFIFWIESIKVTKDRQQEKYMENMFHEGFYTIFARTYTALIVDYRLICCILFVEHALEIDKMIERGENYERISGLDHIREEASIKIVHPWFRDYQRFTTSIKRLKGSGIIIGLVLVLLQILNAFVYFKEASVVGPWANIFGCLAAWSFLIAGVWLLLETRSIKDEDGEKREENVGIQYLMTLMGLVGVMFWICSAVSTWKWSIMAKSGDAKRYPYLTWTTIKILC